MRILILAVLLAILGNMGFRMLETRYPDQVSLASAQICQLAPGDWLCPAGETDSDDAQRRVEYTSANDDRYSCPLSGCCSGHHGVRYLDLETDKVICNNLEVSPSCKCERLAK